MYKYIQYPLCCGQKLLTARNYSSKQTHYEILNLNPNCTSKEIRDSFLKLSKQYHPDVQGASNNAKKTAQFVKISEAYNVLSKQSSRQFYDLSLSNTSASSWKPETNTASWNHFYSQNPKPGSYYGLKGVKKVSNLKVVVVLLIFTTVGTAFEIFLVRNSLTFRREKLDEISKISGQQHAEAQADAIKYGNEKQLERLTQRILRST